MDIATVAGIGLGFVLIIVAIVMGGSPAAFFNPPSLLIVLGGTIATAFIRFPMPVVLRTAKVIRNAFFEKTEPVEDMIRQIVELSELARRESVLALDNVEIEDDFLRKGIQLAVDGTDPGLIRQILNTELVAILDRHRVGNKIFRGIGESAPAFGMIGTLIGLVKMLANLSDPSSIGAGMAVALLTTFYGAVLANLIFVPMVTKLDRRIQIEVTQIQLVIVGLVSIHGGDNSTILKEKMHAFLQHEPAEKPHEEVPAAAEPVPA